MKIQEYPVGCNTVREWESRVRAEGKNYLAHEPCDNCRVALYFEVPKGKEIDDFKMTEGRNVKCPNCGCLVFKDILEEGKDLGEFK